jgi:hypothetical protein
MEGYTVNREVIIPGGAGIYPLTGDVQSTAGNATVTVIGLQNIKMQSGVPLPGAVLTYNQNDNQWEPTQRACIQVNGISVSDDYFIAINADNVSINGTPVS